MTARSATDRAKTLSDILADLRGHYVAGADTAEIREAVEHEEDYQYTPERLPRSIIALGLILFWLFVLWWAYFKYFQ